MKTKTSSYNTSNDTREHIIDVGTALSLSLGFNAMGLSELLKTAETPKGSFYHYFRSKEAFGEAMLSRYFERYDQDMVSLFNQPNLDYKQSVMSYFSAGIASNSCSENYGNCLVVKLSAEVCDLSETMRHALQQGTERIIRRLAETIALGQNDGSISNRITPAILADTFYSLWIGAALRTKITHSTQPLVSAMESIERTLAH